jgi:hypothetical protein
MTFPRSGHWSTCWRRNRNEGFATLTDLAIQLFGSLAAVFFLAFIAFQFGLGGDVRIRDEKQARMLADEAVCGFETVDIALDRAGIGALLRDAQGRVMLLRRHGSHFVSRILDSHVGMRLDHNFLIIATGDRQFGTITLNLGAKAQIWAASLRRLGG